MDRLVVVITDASTQHARAVARDGDRADVERRDRQPDAAQREGQARRLRHRQLGRSRRHRGAHARGLSGRSSPISRRVPAGKRRALGQHFLRDPGIARAIVDLVAPTARDLVVEIGPGEGALTEELARRGGRLIALEVDPQLIERLRRRFPQVEVQHADARGMGLRRAGPTAGRPGARRRQPSLQREQADRHRAAGGPCGRST